MWDHHIWQLDNHRKAATWGPRPPHLHMATELKLTQLASAARDAEVWDPFLLINLHLTVDRTLCFHTLTINSLDWTGWPLLYVLSFDEWRAGRHPLCVTHIPHCSLSLSRSSSPSYMPKNVPFFSGWPTNIPSDIMWVSLATAVSQKIWDTPSFLFCLFDVYKDFAAILNHLNGSACQNSVLNECVPKELHSVMTFMRTATSAIAFKDWIVKTLQIALVCDIESQIL